VKNEVDLRAFLGRIERYLEFFVGEVSGRAATPFEVKALAERWAAAPYPSTSASPILEL
jgi:hypothetical protein